MKRTRTCSLLISLILLTCMPLLAQKIIVTPSSFSAETFSNRSNGDTILFSSGNYLLTENIYQAWRGISADRVKFLSESDAVVIDASSFDVTKLLKFKNKNQLKFENLKFKNVKLELYQCNDCVFENISIEGQRSAHPQDHQCNIMNIYKSNNTTIQSCDLKWTYEGKNGKGVKFWSGTNNQLIDTNISGRLRGAVDSYAGTQTLLIKGGNFSREVESGAEDHGIYVHDFYDCLIDGVTIQGFTNTSAGGSIKIKNMSNVEVRNCTLHTSGIWLRIESKTNLMLNNLWIHDNYFTAAGDAVNIYTPNFNPSAIVVENNIAPNARVRMGTNASLLNQYCERAQKNGGLYNNGFGSQPSISNGLNNSGNYIIQASFEGENYALNKPTSQSSKYSWRTPASKAVDGNTGGNFRNSEVTHTRNQSEAYWQVDLEEIRELEKIKIWNRTDSNSSRLSNFYVFISETPFLASTVAETQNQEGVISIFHQGAAGNVATLDLENNQRGRYIRVQLTENEPLSLAEVEAFGYYQSPNIALNKNATQSSNYSWRLPASKAVDGNRGGNFRNNEISHTSTGSQQYWDLDLNGIALIDSINIWNRTDCCSNRLSNFHVFVSKYPFTGTTIQELQNQNGVIDCFFEGALGRNGSIAIPDFLVGRYIRIQLSGNNLPLALAEVEVKGTMLTEETVTTRSAPVALSSLTKDKVVIYPVPASSNIYVKANSEIDQYIIYDMMGKQIMNKKVDCSTNLNINISNLSSGRYVILMLNNQQEIYSESFVKGN